MDRALIHYSEGDLKAAIREEAKRVEYSYEGLVAEYDRRIRIKQTSFGNSLALAAAGIASIALLAAVMLKGI